MMKNEILVNKDNALGSDFVPSGLVVCDDNENNFHDYIDPGAKPMVLSTVNDSFNLFNDKAFYDGYYFIIDSGYRSYEYQQKIFEYFAKKYGKDYAYKRVAIPGTSEHQTGLAIDVASFINYQIRESLTYNEIKYLKNNLYKYGFILRYPYGKEQITGFRYEPWHYRYVGNEIAEYIYKNNITLEEYLNKANSQSYIRKITKRKRRN